MGAVVVSDEDGPLARFQQKVLEDAADMAKRTGGRIRLVGGRSAEERQRIREELVRLGVPVERISSAAEVGDAARAAIELLVEN